MAKTARRFPTLADRVWYAWQCLPHDEHGCLPAWRSLERERGLANATFHRLITGETARPSADSLLAVADALRTDAAWLLHEIGDAPTPQKGWPILSRPEIYRRAG